ncbi:MAG TPA: hypothetical protein VLS48_01435, partial [Anaerolineales bacterium]|nr:hypothetical protein [Anaerolineales bacterium]
MDAERALLVIGVTLILVLALNFAIVATITRGKKRRNNPNTVEMLRRAAKRARSPWEQEDADLAELSRLAALLK